MADRRPRQPFRGVDAYDNLIIIGDLQLAGSEYSRVYALGANGIERWHHDYDDQQFLRHPTTGPAVGADGRLYLARSVITFPEDGTAHLEALNPDGTVRWDKPVADEISGRPIVDADGNLYFGAKIDGQCFVLSLSPEGTERWRLNCNGDGPAMVGSMDIDGTLYAVDQSGLFAIRHTTP